ncbi:MAG: ATP synthase subunit I [Chitinophagaceae bacterium]
MSEIPYLILASLAGILLGIIFFGGLWLTVRKTVSTQNPALWIFGSFVLRIAITLAGFYFIGSGNWKKLLACLVGFIVARFIVIHVTKSIDEKRQLKKETNYGA